MTFPSFRECKYVSAYRRPSWDYIGNNHRNKLTKKEFIIIYQKISNYEK